MPGSRSPKDSSGTAHFLKKYLGLINKATLETEKGAIKTWNEISEGKEDTTWPKAINAVKTSVKGEAAEDELVSNTPGSIGFGNLAEVRGGKLTLTRVPLQASSRKPSIGLEPMTGEAHLLDGLP